MRFDVYDTKPLCDGQTFFKSKNPRAPNTNILPEGNIKSGRPVDVVAIYASLSERALASSERLMLITGPYLDRYGHQASDELGLQFKEGKVSSPIGLELVKSPAHKSDNVVIGWELETGTILKPTISFIIKFHIQWETTG